MYSTASSPRQCSDRFCKLLNIRLGPGAAVLSKDVKRIHMDFSLKYGDGQVGPRKFWRLFLPRLQYHNPAVSMTISRTTNTADPATMSIFFSSVPESGASSSSSSDGQVQNTAVNERLQTINMKHKHESDILKELLQITEAVEVKATEKELEMMRDIEEQRKKSDEDREFDKVVQEKKRQETQLLDQARRAAEGTMAGA